MPARFTFRRFAWAAVLVNLGVILWGAVVRATGSGAGCGSHWPLCDGQVVPPSQAVATLIEYTHRATSGLALILVAILTFWALRSFPRLHRVRKAAIASLILIFIEALVGAGLVIFHLVEDNASPARAVYMGVHLTNTLALMAALTLTAAWGEEDGEARWSRGRASALMWGCLVGLVASGITGAV
ncbi:MAG: COX15/CtaA family protein, partial [Acidobacteria bacterium]|nr:COX15/CtaA family protein [Acidobacteriota bacterium]